jgi:hypothetical protein
MRIARTYIYTIIADQLLKTNPDVSLQVFNQVPDMYGPVCIGQSTGYKNFSLALGHPGRHPLEKLYKQSCSAAQTRVYGSLKLRRKGSRKGGEWKLFGGSGLVA